MTSWNSIVEANAAGLVRCVRRIVGNDHDTEDVVQEVFLEAWKMPNHEAIENWPGFLRRMAHRRAIDRVRKRIRAKESTSLAEPERVIASEDAPDANLAATELAEALRKAITELTPTEATVFTMTYFDELDRTEISQTLEVSVNAVTVSLHKARKRLKELLGPQTTRSRANE